MEDIIELRHQLHALAELSGREIETNRFLCEWIEATHPDVLVKNIGGYGLASVYRGRLPGKRVMIRGDIDALHISEPNDIPYRSQHQGVSHKCGHDGHAAMLCGLARQLAECRPQHGEVVLLFQPAEETGQGAKAVISDPKFKDIVPDTAYGLHNLPGFAKGQVLIRKGCFAAASFGMKMVFEGKTAHASQPETGKSSSELLALLIHQLEKKREMLHAVKPLTTFVITHARLGEAIFGVAPGFAELWLTLRSFDDRHLELLANEVAEMCRAKAKNHLFDFRFSMHEAFSATNNNDNNVNLIENAATQLGLSVGYLTEPFRWSEDFGRFGQICPTGFFGLGSGLEQPALHDARSDFPDDILQTGIALFDRIIRLEAEGH